MNELLTKVLDAHGGLERWRSYNKVEATIVSGGGFFALKGVLQDANPRRMTVWLHEERSSVTPYGAADQIELFDIDMLASRIGYRLILDMHHQDLAEHEREAAERDLLHEGAFHRDRRFCDTGNADPHRGRQLQAGFFWLFDALGKGNRRDAHLLGQRERYQIDDELLVGANIGASVLWLSRSPAADANTYCRGIAAKDIEERERRGVDCAGGVTGRHPRDRSRQNGREQQSVAFERAHPFEIKLHGFSDPWLPGLSGRL